MRSAVYHSKEWGHRHLCQTVPALVSCPKVQADQVQVVGQVRELMLASASVSELIPISTEKPSDLKSIHCIKGVGISAIVDIRV